jgi:hypothetical protein
MGKRLKPHLHSPRQRDWVSERELAVLSDEEPAENNGFHGIIQHTGVAEQTAVPEMV